ncbi:MAG: PrpF domain-containing protein [Mycobacterium sp.]
MPQRGIPAVWMRGGTSKGLMVRDADLPPPGPDRDAVVLEIMGSPDVGQIDGMGGGSSSTSKVITVRSSRRPGVDVDFLFGQVSVRDALIDWKPNSGNLTSAVCAYVVDEGLVPAIEPETTFVLYNENTRTNIRATVPVVNGRAAVQGDVDVAGVPRPGAQIINEYLDPVGKFRDRGALPTGSPIDIIETPFGAVEASFVDAANLVMFVDAESLGIDGTILPAQVNSDDALLEKFEQVRTAGAVHLGLVEPGDVASIASPILPLLSVVSKATDYQTTQGTAVNGGDIDFVARVFSLQRMHHAHPLTGLICTSVAGVTPGTVPNRLRGEHGDAWVRGGHPKGVAAAEVRFDSEGVVDSVAVVRTARRLMAGEVYVRA